MSDQSIGGTDRREWTCSECGASAVFPDTRVLEHYGEEHGDEYGHLIGGFRTGEGEWRSGQAVTDQSEVSRDD